MIILQNLGLNESLIQNRVLDVLHSFDGGEIFLENSVNENFLFENNLLKRNSCHSDSGFGLRGFNGEAVSYVHSSNINLDQIDRACKILNTVIDKDVNLDASTKASNRSRLYPADNPIETWEFDRKLSLIKSINEYIRNKDKTVKQVSISLNLNHQTVNIINNLGVMVEDIRPLIKLTVSVIVESSGRTEIGFSGVGGRCKIGDILYEEQWKKIADQALQQANVNTKAIEAPAGKRKLVLGAGWPGVLLHEAVGHGLEADFNRKKTSVFTGLIGKTVANDVVTVIDDGTIKGCRGSLNVDDEGTPTQKNVLIENGKLVNYMQDRKNAILMGDKPTGNGRRESYKHCPMPRMTNTYMASGEYKPEEIIASVDNGIYASNFSGGQVDITSGQFVFSASEAYLIEGGEISTPVKGMTIIGKGSDVIKKISKVADNSMLDSGIGICGKDGQSVPVGVGQPALLIDEITIGGTNT